MMFGTADQPLTRNTLRRIDEGWSAFEERAKALNNAQLTARLGDGEWTRKQMLAHISAWHELTTNRLLKFVETGQPVGLPNYEHDDSINTRTARASEGRTTGEIVIAMTDTHRRLRRTVAALTDEQLAAHDGWAAAVIAGNSFDHYTEHLPDLDPAHGR
ncbi:MAG TPA: DinB family protein [Candidatus Limnocylindrales bacterium]|nr:DinB family protein [Candidatus Limnocylindrales bacterium]